MTVAQGRQPDSQGYSWGFGRRCCHFMVPLREDRSHGCWKSLGSPHWMSGGDVSLLSTGLFHQSACRNAAGTSERVGQRGASPQLKSKSVTHSSTVVTFITSSYIMLIKRRFYSHKCCEERFEGLFQNLCAIKRLKEDMNSPMAYYMNTWVGSMNPSATLYW